MREMWSRDYNESICIKNYFRIAVIVIIMNLFKTDFLIFSDRNDNDDGADKTVHETRPSVKRTNDTDKSTTLIAGREKNPISRTRMVIKNRI